MTAAYRWFLDLSGADLLVGYAVLCALAVVAGYALYELGALIWSHTVEAMIRRRARQEWPVRFVERPASHDTRWPMLATVAIVALFIAIFAQCGGGR